MNGYIFICRRWSPNHPDYPSHKGALVIAAKTYDDAKKIFEKEECESPEDIYRIAGTVVITGEAKILYNDYSR